MNLMPYEDFKSNETVQYGTAATSASVNHAPLLIKKELNDLYNYTKIRFGEYPFPWDSRSTYSVGDIVESGGILYQCIQNNSNQQPPSASWEVYDTTQIDMDLKYLQISSPEYVALKTKDGYYTMHSNNNNTDAIMSPKNGLVPWDNGISSNLGTSTSQWKNIYGVNGHFNAVTTTDITATTGTITTLNSTTVNAVTLNGTASTAKYADIAEKYVSDKKYESGTVLELSDNPTSDIEVTLYNSGKVAGVVSDKPGYMLNSEIDGIYVALKGRTPVNINGSAEKGDYIIADIDGKGIAVKELTFETSLKLLGICLENGINRVEIKI